VRRPERFAEALKEEIAEVVGFELEDPRVEAVTVTDVVISQDLRDARVFVVVEGDEEEKKSALKTLQHAMAFVRQQVALNLDLRHVPHLHFVRDTAEENASRVAGLLDELETAGELRPPISEDATSAESVAD
jgi:ribosome-binding factor A